MDMEFPRSVGDVAQNGTVRYGTLLNQGKIRVNKKVPSGTVLVHSRDFMKVRTETRRNALLQAAVELFQEKGYERASINELVRRCGGSKQTVYGYFPSKEALFMAVVKEVATGHMPGAVEELRSDAGSPASLEDQLVRFGERMMEVLTNDARPIAVYRMVMAEAGQSDVGRLFHDSGPTQLVGAVAGLFEAAIERGELRRADPKVLATQFTSLLTAETSPRLYERNPPPVAPEEIRAMVRRAVDTFLFGATPRPAAAPAPSPRPRTAKAR
jgi:AcrR family transcriptional regulator